MSVTDAAHTDLQYEASGEDTYRIESAQTFSRVSYAGTERLSIARQGPAWRFEARATYTRNGPDGRSQSDAVFVQLLQPNGTFEDRVDDDPDFLTILNQPFAVRLDDATLHDLRELHGHVPFAATSPLGAQAVLHGFLRPAPGGPVAGRQTIAVRFEAAGGMTGPLPGYSETLVAGTMRMQGTAYYAADTAMLLALNVSLTLDARLAQGRPAVSVPVRIVYRRVIRAVAKTPPRTQPAAGGATVAPGAR
ncbi:MAG: hypothetical protein JO146_04335 [Candidatus Eremiobacteraeota bacterium]|nr:hypothetical protein [Candidatus Eremiobacteraeota bacterium]